jgi:hypothetical protein
MEIGLSQEVQMCSWANFYQGLANEAKMRAARAPNPSMRDNFEATAKEWSTLAAWAELRAN